MLTSFHFRCKLTFLSCSLSANVQLTNHLGFVVHVEDGTWSWPF